MKKSFLIIFLICFSQILTAQNLVSNPSFEEHDTCPDNLGQVSKAIDWTQINSADYFNYCITGSQVSVPNNFFGYQCPSSGSAYCGFYLFNEWWPSGVEFIQGRLINSMIVGQKYYVNFKLSMANGSNCGIDKIGLMFTNTLFGDTIIDYNTSINFAHIYSTSIITDTINWVSVRGSFVADSLYKYFLIGNFFDSSNVNIACTTTTNRFSYYYVDDFCVSIDSLTCEVQNSINICDSNVNILKANLSNPYINIYPNPTNKILNFSSNISINKILLYDSFGKIWKQEVINSIDIINISELVEGIYFLKIESDNKIFNKKIIVYKP